MGGACGTNGGQEMHTVCQWQNLNVRDHLEDPGVNISTLYSETLSPFSPS